MTSYKGLGHCLLGGLVLIVTFGSLASAIEKPNIVYILADDLGYGDVQALNRERGMIPTPCLDKLATQAMTFRDAHSGSSVCTPTRYGLLTGRYAWRTRLQSGVLDGGNDDPLIDENRLTVAKLLQEHGYDTACIGKWHLGFQSESATGKTSKAEGVGKAGLPVDAKIIGGPTTRGFDLFLGCSNARTMASLIQNDRVIELIEPVEMLPRIAKAAVQYVEDHAKPKSTKPFFLYLPLTSPHTPIVPSKEWKGVSPLGEYADFVMQTDSVVGQVLDALDRGGLTEETMVIFTSDNGCSPAAGTNKLEKAGHFASASYRGYKSDIWEGGHRVPFFVRWPGKVRAGSISDQLICQVDLMATCAEILEETLPSTAGEDSISFLSSLKETESSIKRTRLVNHSIQGKFAIRDGRWKLCLCEGSGGWSKEEADYPQLYDLQTDPDEQKNLSGEQPELVKRLRDELALMVSNGRSTPGANQTNDVNVSFDNPKATTKTKKASKREKDK